jgi:hypothetical protein
MEFCKLTDLKPGMIGLSSGPGFIQKAIKTFTRGEYAHSFVIISGPYEELSVIETSSTIIKVTPLVNKLSELDVIDIWEPLATEEEKKQALLQTYKEYAGGRYGYESYLWFMYRAGIRLVGVEPLTMWDWVSHGTTCTELSCYYVSKLSEVFSRLFQFRDFNTFAPTELRLLMGYKNDMFKSIGRLI